MDDAYNEADAKATIAIADAQEQLQRARLVQEAVDDGRKLVTVRQISVIDDIPGADLIKVATVEGWKVVVKAGEFQPGDLCVFFEVDSFLPMADSRFEFLEKNATVWRGVRGARLKTIRLRKQLSQGLALPLDLFPEILKILRNPNIDIEMVRQLNFTAAVGVMKWEKVMSAQLQGQAKGNFPSWLRKSDQERAQNMGDKIFGTNVMVHGGLLVSRYPVSAEQIALMPLEALENACATGRMVLLDGEYFHVKGKDLGPALYEVSIKLDGSSMTVYVRNTDEGEVRGVCSRNLDLKLEGSEDNAFVKAASSVLFELIAEQGGDVALQGELMGPGIQGNREGLVNNEFFIYNIFDIKSGEFMTPEARAHWIMKANAVSKVLFGYVMLKQVPILHESITLEELGITNMDELLAYAVGPSMNHKVREGLVFKARDGRHQFKVISNEYLLAE